MTPRRRISVLIADSYPIMLEGLKSALLKSSNINVVGATSTGKQCLEIIDGEKPDVALVDFNLPDMSVDKIIEKVKTKGINTRFIVLSTGIDQLHIKDSLKAGAYGFILKDSSIKDFLDAIEKVNSGHTYFSEKISQILLDGYVKGSTGNNQTSNLLSEREKEVLKLIADGLTTKNIADQLGVSPRTVDTHRERIMSKLNIRTIAGLTKYAIKHGITTL